MKYTTIINSYELTEKQKRDLLPVRRKKHEFVTIRINWLLSLGEIDEFKLTSRVLLSLLARLSTKKFKRIYIDEIRDEIGAKRMAVERAIHTLCDKGIILNEAIEKEGMCRPKYFKFNPDFEDIDIDEFADEDEEND